MYTINDAVKTTTTKATATATRATTTQVIPRVSGLWAQTNKQ